MPDLTTTSASAPRLTRPFVVVAGLGTALLAATGLLWVHYGTAVFYEMIAAGLASCF